MFLRKRPGTITAAAVLNIVYGSLFLLCCGLNGLLQTFVPNAFDFEPKGAGAAGKSKEPKGAASAGKSKQPRGTASAGKPIEAESAASVDIAQELDDEQERQIPAFKSIQAGNAVVYIFIGIFMIVLGIGLIKMQGWARWGTIGIWLFEIVFAIGYTAFAIIVVVPAADRALEIVAAKHPNDPEVATLKSSGLGVFVAAGVVVGAVIECAFAASVLLLMITRSARTAFSGVTSEPWETGESWGEHRRDNDWDRGGGYGGGYGHGRYG